MVSPRFPAYFVRVSLTPEHPKTLVLLGLSSLTWSHPQAWSFRKLQLSASLSAPEFLTKAIESRDGKRVTVIW